MKYRIAKLCDIKDIVDIHYSIRDTYSVGFFSHMRKPFIRQYYRILLQDKNEIIVCAEDNNGKIAGFCSSTLDMKSQLKHIKKHKFRLGISALSSLIAKPSLILQIFERFKAIDSSGNNKIIITEGARSEYWAWDTKNNDSISSVEMYFANLKILKSLGVKTVSGEVDKVNRKVLAFQKANGFKIIDEIKLSDGRERYILSCDLTNWNPKI